MSHAGRHFEQLRKLAETRYVQGSRPCCSIHEHKAEGVQRLRVGRVTDFLCWQFAIALIAVSLGDEKTMRLPIEPLVALVAEDRRQRLVVHKPNLLHREKPLRGLELLSQGKAVQRLRLDYLKRSACILDVGSLDAHEHQ